MNQTDSRPHHCEMEEDNGFIFKRKIGDGDGSKRTTLRSHSSGSIAAGSRVTKNTSTQPQRPSSALVGSTRRKPEKQREQQEQQQVLEALVGNYRKLINEQEEQRQKLQSSEPVDSEMVTGQLTLKTIQKEFVQELADPKNPLHLEIKEARGITDLGSGPRPRDLAKIEEYRQVMTQLLEEKQLWLDAMQRGYSMAELPFEQMRTEFEALVQKDDGSNEYSHQAVVNLVDQYRDELTTLHSKLKQVHDQLHTAETVQVASSNITGVQRAKASAALAKNEPNTHAVIASLRALSRLDKAN